MVRIWPLEAPDWRDPLWQATTYCPSVDERVELLGVAREDAAARRSVCMQTVAEQAARGAYGPNGSQPAGASRGARVTE